MMSRGIFGLVHFDHDPFFRTDPSLRTTSLPLILMLETLGMRYFRSPKCPEYVAVEFTRAREPRTRPVMKGLYIRLISESIA